MAGKKGMPMPNAQLVACRLASKENDDQPDDDEQVKRFKALRRHDPFKFEQFLAQLERDLKAGRRGADPPSQEVAAPAVDVPVVEVEDDGKALEICRTWLKQRGVQ